MEKVLFITNSVFVDESKPEGGVRYCTTEYINLLKTRFDVEIFSLHYNRSLIRKIKGKLGIDVFEDYNEADYKVALVKTIRDNRISKVFINLSSTSAVSKVVKDVFGNQVSVVLCSHGIEAGDFLHHTVRFKKFLPFLHRCTSAYKLGKILQKELEYRLDCFDLILTVSDIEFAIEKWLGAKKTFMVPRITAADFIEWHPVDGRLGFVGDVSHYPNYYGLLKLCEAIQQSPTKGNISIRVVGKECSNLTELVNKFPFVTALGYLDNKDLIKEASSWMYYLNLVFYYSKGVSTKLSKGMNWGLPVISTEAGNRGYQFKQGGVLTASSPAEIVQLVAQRIANNVLLQEDKSRVELAVRSSAQLQDIMDEIISILQ